MGSKLIEKRKEYEAKKGVLTAIFKEAGEDLDTSKITLLQGDDAAKRNEITKKNLELEALAAELVGLVKLEAEARAQAKREGIQMPDDKLPGQETDVKDWTEVKQKNGQITKLYRGKSLGDVLVMIKEKDNAQLKAMGIDVGEAGGFAVPDQWATNIMMVTPPEAIMRPRARVLPPGTPPDAKLDLPALRQGASGVYGGVTFTAANEGTAGITVDPKLDLVVLEPQRLSGNVVVGNSLLRNATAMSAFIEQLFRNAKAGFEDFQFLQGAGLGYPLGVLNAPGATRVPRATAATIHFADIANMLSKQIGPNPIWVASKSALPQIVTLADANNNAMWIPAAYGGIQGNLPGTLAGLPIIFDFKQPILGQVGDLMLIDPSFYFIKDGSGPYIQASEHVLFTSDQTVIKMTFFLDGQPWCKTPLLMDDGVSIASPYVILQ